MRGTAFTWCISLRESAVQQEGYGSISKWPVAVRALVADGKDEDLRQVAGLGSNSFTTGTIAKAWSVLGWMAEKRPQGLLPFLRALDGDASPDEAATRAFGTDLPALDTAWREWIRLAFE